CQVARTAGCAADDQRSPRAGAGAGERGVVVGGTPVPSTAWGSGPATRLGVRNGLRLPGVVGQAGGPRARVTLRAGAGRRGCPPCLLGLYPQTAAEPAGGPG
ncbi:MAG: hypothetical protein AVDCRST_MAG07-156, partial [uncultured Frankineae bacterium]